MGVNGIYGLSGSGLDVESMVKVGMLSKQSEYEKMQQKYTKDEWKKTEMLSLYGEIQTFNASTLSKYKMSSNMNSRSAASANSSIVTATANANAATMTHYVEVEHLASSAYLIGTKTLERENTAADQKTQLSSVLYKSIEAGTDAQHSDSVLVKLNDTDPGTYYAMSDTAFSFSINDGVNGLLASENSDVLVATASPDAATGTYKVAVSKLGTAAITTGSTRLGGTKDSPIYSFFYGDLKSTLTTNSTNTDTAIAFTFGDNKKNAKIDFTFEDLNDSVENFVANINKQFKDNGLSLEADYVEGTGTTTSGATTTTIALSIKNTQEGSDNHIIIGSNLINSAFDNIAKSKDFANTLFLGKNKTDGVAGEDTFFRRVEGTNATVTVQKVTESNGTTTTTNVEDISVKGNTITTPDGMTITAKAKTTGMEISNNKSQVVSVTYRELLEGFTFYDLTSKVNSMGLNVRANYDSVQDRFSFYNKKSGEENQINIEIGTNNGDGTVTVTETAADNAAKFFNTLGLKQSSNGKIVGDTLNLDASDTSKRTISQAGVNAMAKIDGIEYKNLDSNNLTVDGVTYNFQNLTETGNVAVTVTQDTESIVKNVQSFVDDYNALLTKLYKWYDEKPNSDYKPLTETQKSGMKEEQIEKWEAKAKAGMLYHDKTLGNVITELRSAVSENVEGVNGKYKNIFAIGISTTGLKGQLTLDKDKLKAAIADDPDAVYNVFAKLDGGEKQYLLKDSSGKTFWSANRDQKDCTIVKDSKNQDTTRIVERASHNGIAQRLGDVFMASMKSVKAVSGSTASITEDSELNNLMRELQTKMSNFKRMMQAFETRLYKKYDAMESSLALLGSQLNYVTSAFQ